MAQTALLNISGYVTGLPGNSITNIGPIAITSAAANGSITEVVLQAGDNTITIPTTNAPTGCVIQLPSGNTQVTKFKGAGGDTGFAIGKTTTQVICWDPTALTANFILNSAGTQTGLVTRITFF